MSFIISPHPRYNCTGWLGVKYQHTYHHHHHLPPFCRLESWAEQGQGSPPWLWRSSGSWKWPTAPFTSTTLTSLALAFTTWGQGYPFCLRLDQKLNSTAVTGNLLLGPGSDFVCVFVSGVKTTFRLGEFSRHRERENIKFFIYEGNR